MKRTYIIPRLRSIDLGPDAKVAIGIADSKNAQEGEEIGVRGQRQDDGTDSESSGRRGNIWGNDW